MRPSPGKRSWRSALVATVVPWETAATAGRDALVAGSADAPFVRRRIFRMPSSTPTDGSWGVDGVLVVKISPVASSTATTSVNVPPVSMPIRRRRLTAGSVPLVAEYMKRVVSGQTPFSSEARTPRLAREESCRGEVQDPIQARLGKLLLHGSDELPRI